MASRSTRVRYRRGANALLEIPERAVDDRLSARHAQSPSSGLGDDVSSRKLFGVYHPVDAHGKDLRPGLNLGDGHHVIERRERGNHLLAVEKRRVLGVRVPISKHQIRNELAQQLSLLSRGRERTSAASRQLRHTLDHRP